MSDALLGTALGGSVLLIDDDPDVHALVQAMLKPLGINVTVAMDGLQGLAMAREAPPNVILLDYNLPIKSGLEVVEEVLQDETLRGVPVIMVTGNDSHSTLAACFTAGAQDYLRKPFFAAELRARVGSAIERERLVKELTTAAKRDKLTGLPNRAFLHDRLQALTHAVQRKQSNGFTVMFLDFDRFKLINDSLGHDVGDQLLQGISHRLRDNLRASDTLALETPATTVARLGGDEFVVLLDRVSDPSVATAIAERLLRALALPYQLGPHTVCSSASIGIACNSGQYSSADDLLRDADIAMYEAKCRGKACVVHFSVAMREAVANRHALENDLREAIDARTLHLAYQPIISLDDRRIAGVEALIRWSHPVRGPIAPVEFIPIAEETRLILPLSRWILETACADFVRWRDELGSSAPGYVSVNLSRVQLADPGLVDRTMDVLKRFGMEPRNLQLEVTESQIMTNRDSATRLMADFQAAGVRLAMDDFGTGYSSLSCLQAFPLDVLKVDREFIANLCRGREFAALVQAVISLADNLGLETVAEGIEELEQVATLQALGCAHGQGFLLAMPMSSDELMSRLLASNTIDDVFHSILPPASLPLDATLVPTFLSQGAG